jgi:hypothetical protein
VPEEVPVVRVRDGLGQVREVEEEVPGLAELARVVQSLLLKPNNVKSNLFVWRWYRERVEIAWSGLTAYLP